jgi:hypothetical protein
MFVTQYGNFSGTTWESMFQVIFKRKFMPQGYQTVKASPGDFGIEGFTRDGQVFQCYCPEVNSDNKKLYEQQRDKVTADLNKLKTYTSELKSILGGVRIQKWILVTPRISHHDLTLHCNTKRDWVKSQKLEIVHDDFDVLVHEADDYALEIGEYFNSSERRLTITPSVGSEKLVEWKNTEIDLVNNAIEKNTIRVEVLTNRQNLERKVNDLTDKNARDYLNGESILRLWQSSQPDNHQRFVELMATVEEELIEKCLLNETNPNVFVNSIGEFMEERIKSSFPYLDDSMILRLKNYSTSTWILRCPIYFETI